MLTHRMYTMGCMKPTVLASFQVSLHEAQGTTCLGEGLILAQTPASAVTIIGILKPRLHYAIFRATACNRLQ